MASRTTAERIGGKLARADAEVHALVAPHGRRPLVKAISAASDLADQPQLRLICGTFIAIGLLARDRKLARSGLRMLLAHELATLMKGIVKGQVDRTRPRTAETMHERKLRPGQSSHKEESSFPSGHTAGAVAAARAFARDYPEHRAPAYAAAGFVATAQVPRCAHYVSDVGAGATIGLVGEATAALILPKSEAAAEV